jgi:tetratricopeptide (TPR) repeat protein
MPSEEVQDKIRLLRCRHNLAYWLVENGKREVAIDLYIRVLTDRVRLLGPESPETLITWRNLAGQLGLARETDRALLEYSELLPVLGKVAGVDHRWTLDVRGDRAYILDVAGRVAESLQMYKDLLDDRVRVFGPDDPDTLRSRHDLAAEIERAGDSAVAIEQFRALVADRTRILGADDPDTLTTRYYLADTLGRSGAAKASEELTWEAIKELSDLVSDTMRIHGGDSRKALIARFNLAFLLAQANAAGESGEELVRLRADCMRVLGPDEELTCRVDQLLELIGH